MQIADIIAIIPKRVITEMAEPSHGYDQDMDA